MLDDEDRQVEWEAVIDNDTKKYVSLLVGQMDDEEQRAEKDEENYYDSSEWDQTTKNYFLSYHEVQAHLRWIASQPAEAEAYKRFQVGNYLRLFPFVRNLSLIHLMFRCGTVSRWRRAKPRFIHWGLVSMGASSQFESWGMMMMVMKTMTALVTVGRPAQWTRLEKGFLCTAVSQKFSWAITEWGTCYSNLIACNEIFV
jgi:hypothetical protein